MPAKTLAFASSNFSESGLFNELRRIQIKNLSRGALTGARTA
jgi:hypothetical protein